MNVSLRQYGELLAGYLKSQWRRAVLLAVLLLAGTALPLLNPQILRRFIDGAAAGASTRSLVGTALMFVAVALVSQAVTVATVYLSAQVGWDATNLLRADLALHCLRLDMPFHNARTPGELIERIDGDVTALSNFFSQFVVSVLGSGLLLAGMLVLIMREDPRVGLVMAAFAATALAALAALRGLAVPHMTAEREAKARLFGFLEERLAGVEDIRANGAGSYVMRRFHEAMRVVFHTSRLAVLMSNGIWVATNALFAAGTALILALGAWQYRAGAITLGTVYLFFQYTQMLRRPLEQITQQLREFQRAGAGVGRIHELYRSRPSIADAPPGRGRGELPSGALAAELDGVSFAYHAGEPVLTDISLRLAPGTALGLLGRTGSGKTTLTRLLVRLYDAQEGSIRLGGVDIRQVRLAALRARVGVVTQDVQLFQASVRDNLTLFDPSIPDERVLAVLAELGLLDWYWALPRGLDTQLAAGGGGLSAGEAQLLAFARVFLRDPGLVILDEASSRLDPATERLIERAVDRLLAGRTGIIVAHRLATVQRADDILILDGGRAVEHGPRDCLARDPASRFAGLLRTGLEQVLV